MQLPPRSCRAETFSTCTPQGGRPSRLAQDRALAQQLWETSERAVGASVASGARRSEVALIAPELEGRTVLCMPARQSFVG